MDPLVYKIYVYGAMNNHIDVLNAAVQKWIKKQKTNLHAISETAAVNFIIEKMINTLNGVDDNDDDKSGGNYSSGVLSALGTGANVVANVFRGGGKKIVIRRTKKHPLFGKKNTRKNRK